MKSRCIICSQRRSVLCKDCVKNPFNIEKLRHYYASSKNYKKFKSLYSKKYVEIRDLNTGTFWDKKLHVQEYLKDQDGMTQDRVAIAASYVSKDISKILDIGVGHAYLESILRHKKNIKLNGIDISKDAINNAKEKYNGKFYVQSIYSLDFLEESFDAVFLLEVLEHIPPSKVFSVLKSIKKLIRDNGYIIVSVPSNEDLENKHDNPSGHVRDYTIDIIKTELKLSGFKIVKVEYLYAFKKYYQIKKFISKLVQKRWIPNNFIIKAQKV